MCTFIAHQNHIQCSTKVNFWKWACSVGFNAMASHTSDITKVPVSITDMHLQFSVQEHGCTAAHEHVVVVFVVRAPQTVNAQGPTYVQVVG